MRFFKIVGILAGFGVSLAAAQTPQTDVAIGQLQKLHPAATWKNKSAAVSDVTCDGQPDTIVFGSENGKVLVAVIPGGNPSKPQIFDFPLARDKQNGFCAAPTRINISRLDCDSEEGTLEGCKSVKGCKEFTVDDDDCDAFNFYWDSSQHKVRWWRE
ncbi:MAG TPA: hypothetical protein VMP68_11970 [Candidatus Eisenbacteria bacterium]|nr:hypothetical protein [Candidatus Eisenbacteria bacterium]